MENAIADLIEKLADYVDAVEDEKTSAIKEERGKRVSAIQEKISANTGEELSEYLVSKLSETDSTVLDAIEKMAETVPDEVSLGKPSAKHASSALLTKEEEVKLAEENFANFCVSS